MPQERPLFTALGPEARRRDPRRLPGHRPQGPEGADEQEGQDEEGQEAAQEGPAEVHQGDRQERLDRPARQVPQGDRRRAHPPEEGQEEEGQGQGQEGRARRPAAKKKGKKKKKGSGGNPNATGKGYVLRPSEPNVLVTRGEADKLRSFNVSLLKECKFDSIQAAVNAAGNNDRVVIMPGVYTEPASRVGADQRPEVRRPRGGQRPRPHRRAFVPLPGDLPERPEPGPRRRPRDQRDTCRRSRRSTNRHGIPDEGACIRCNLQIEGSGRRRPMTSSSTRATSRPATRGRPNPVKDVVFRIDRADGFVARNMNVRHAAEHGFYVLETDGYLLDQFKAFYNEEYGVLDVHLGPRPDLRLRRGRLRRLRPVPGRRARDGRADASRGPSATTPRSPAATCTTAPRATPAPTRTASGSTTTTCTTTRTGSRPTSSRRPGTPASRRTRT